MDMLVRLIKAVIGAALLNKAVRSAFIVALIKYAKRSGVSGPAALSALATILLAMMNRREKGPGISRKKQKDKIIDIDEYTIEDDRH
jgi:hypothetical protein